MSAHDFQTGRTGSRILGWLGFGQHPSKREQDGTASGGPLPPEKRGALQRRQLEELGNFLVAHKLEVSALSLSTGWKYLSGSDSQVMRAIDRQIQSGIPVTADWLEETLGGESRDDIALLAGLMERLENSIDEFGRTSRDAHGATSAYHSALEDHVNELEQVTRAGEVISELATIAKVMLRRTRDIERQMLRSEAQTRALRRRLDEARRNAGEDHLTGLPNRRAFEAAFDRQYREARATADRLCVAFCDIDRFKAINDAHGHEAGDRVLKLVAESLVRISGEHCHVARHGGEEFVLLFRSSPLEDCRLRLDGLRQQLADRRLVNRANDQPFGQVSFSAGIADVFGAADPRMALRAADAALYRAKQGGRNRVEVAAEADFCAPRLSAAA